VKVNLRNNRNCMPCWHSNFDSICCKSIDWDKLSMLHKPKLPDPWKMTENVSDICRITDVPRAQSMEKDENRNDVRRLASLLAVVTIAADRFVASSFRHPAFECLDRNRRHF
jgi:hypothetical protein